MAGRPKVGEILLRAGLIDEFQLNAALGEQARWGRPLGATLVKLGFVEEKDLTRALASQLGLPVASLDGKRIPPEVLALVPLEIAERHMVVPLFTKDEGGRDALYVGIEDPGNLSVLDDLSFRAGMEVRPVMVCPSEIWEGIDRYYRHPALDADALSSADSADKGAPAETSGAQDRGSVEAMAAAAGSGSVVTPGTEELARHWMVREDEPAGSAAPDAGSESPAEPPQPAPVAAGTESTTTTREEACPVGASPRDDEVGTGQSPTRAADIQTRTVLRALCQVLLEKGVISSEELHERVKRLEDDASTRN